AREQRDVIVAVAGAPVVVGLQVEPPAPERRQEILREGKFLAAFVLGFFVLVLTLGFFGFVGLILFLLLIALGKLRGGVRCGTSPAGVYVETFALWMVLFIAISYGVGKLPLGEYHLLVGGVVELFTLLVLLWPVLRGVPWRTVREDVGLNL